MNAYNHFQNVLKARQANAGVLLDPGANGTVKITGDDTVLYITDTAGTRTLEDAAYLPLGTRVTVFTSIASVTINSTAMTDGSYLEFIRGVNASGVPEWEVKDPNDVTSDITALAARITALEAGYPLQTIVTDATQARSATDADSGKVIVFTNGSAVAYTIPAGLSIGFNVKVIQAGAGLVTITASSTTINTESAALTTDAQHGAGELVGYAADVYNWHTFAVA